MEDAAECWVAWGYGWDGDFGVEHCYAEGWFGHDLSALFTVV